jgi:hypothetical protein
MVMLKILTRSLFGQAVGWGLFGVGFWLLFTGFLDSSIPLGVLGGVMIPLGMWVMVLVRRGPSGVGDDEGGPQPDN